MRKVVSEMIDFPPMWPFVLFLLIIGAGGGLLLNYLAGHVGWTPIVIAVVSSALGAIGTVMLSERR